MSFQRRSVISFLPLLLFFVSTAIDATDINDNPGDAQKQRRHRRLNGRRAGPTSAEQEEKAAGAAFYDLSHLTNDEKLDMMKKAYWLAHFGESVDWDVQRDKFVRTVRERKLQSRSADPAAAASDDAYQEQLDDALSGNIGETVDTSTGQTAVNGAANPAQLTLESSQPHLPRRLQNNTIDGDVFDGYEYAPGACPAAGALGVPCATDKDLSALCNKYDRDRGSFRACLAACAPAFCCIHDAPRELNYLTPNCNTDENCDQYGYCYIAWWKLEDTVGPALFLRVDQDDEFYDLAAEEAEDYLAEVEVLTPLLLHHFDDIEKVIQDGIEDNVFETSRVFLNEAYWMYPEVGKIDVDNP